MTRPGGGGHDEDLTTWADRIEAVIASTEHCCVDRVVVIAETASTQDAAASMAGVGGAEGGSRLMLLAGQQKSGRGRMGRKWDSGPGGLAVTIALPDQGLSVEWLSLAGGLAMYLTCLPFAGAHTDRLRVKIPNDLVVLDPAGPQGRLKLGGVLVERRAGLVLVGFGINVRQQGSDWNASLAGTAVSLAQLGSDASRIEVAERLVGAISKVCAMDQASVELELADLLTH